MRNYSVAIAIVLASNLASAAPPKGAYKLLSVKDAKQTVVIDEMLKQKHVRGELSFAFDGNTIEIGMWQITKTTDAAKYPDQVLVSICRASATATATWTGASFKLPTPIHAKGWGDGALVTIKKKPLATTDTWGQEAGCDFSLDDESYKVSGTGDRITLTSPKGTFELMRTTPIGEIDIGALAKAYAAE